MKANTAQIILTAIAANQTITLLLSAVTGEPGSSGWSGFSGSGSSEPPGIVVMCSRSNSSPHTVQYQTLSSSSWPSAFSQPHFSTT